jgi:hypothetical protein
MTRRKREGQTIQWLKKKRRTDNTKVNRRATDNTKVNRRRQTIQKSIEGDRQYKSQ